MTGKNPSPFFFFFFGVPGRLGLLMELEAYDRERKVWRGFRQEVAPMWLGSQEDAMAMGRALISQ